MATSNLEDGISKKELQAEKPDEQIQGVVANFLTTYYQTFGTNRHLLSQLYIPESKLIFEGETYTGPQKIQLKFASLPFKAVQHEITSYDFAYTVDNSIIVLVLGKLKTDEDTPLGFCQSFYLKIIEGSLFILNDIFRLNLHNN